MGKFLKYEDSNARTFVVDAVNRTVTRPKRPITKEDLLGAIVEVAAESDTTFQTIVTMVADLKTSYSFIIVGANNSLMQGTYTPATDVFTIDAENYTNIFVDEFGREERYV